MERKKKNRNMELGKGKQITEGRMRERESGKK